jgi:thermitase
MKKQIGSSFLLMILLVTLGFGFSPAPAVQAAVPAQDAGSAYVPGQLIVGFAPSVSLGSIAARAEAAALAVGAKVIKTDGQAMALLDVGTHRNLPALALTIKRLKGVRYAEPNYTVKAAEPPAGGENDLTAGQSMLVAAPPLSSTYPNDPSLMNNAGWHAVSADIVWNNTTASKTICLIDTGVDYLHKDLAGKIIKGPDFVGGDNDPMDDFGHGTHMAGIIAAIPNNSEGIAGVSTGKVLAVKVFDVTGNGTVYDVVMGINYCADQPSVSILATGWGITASTALYNAIYHAIHDRGKLVVAAAGNSASNSTASAYPAAYSVNFPEVIAVTSSGKVNGPTINYACMEGNDTYGNWISLAAPGYSIYSTTPWDKPFLFGDSLPARYAVSPWNGTASATAFAAAAAARVWGYMPTASAAVIAQRLKDTGNTLTVDGTCWSASMPAALKSINLGRAMDRGAAVFIAFDALTLLPIPGAKVTVYNAATNATLSSGVVPSAAATELNSGTPFAYPPFIDVINLPAGALSTQLVAKISATNYAVSPQNAFVVAGSTASNADGKFTVIAGSYRTGMVSYVPLKSANFAVVGQTSNSFHAFLAAWVPNPPAAKYIVSNFYYIPDPNSLVLPYGSLYTDPYARWMRSNTADYEALLIRNRTGATSAAWYVGSYTLGMTDGAVSGVNLMDNINASMFVWKDGVIKARVDKGAVLCGPSTHWWFPLQIKSPASGAATYVKTPAGCGTINDAPYHP